MAMTAAIKQGISLQRQGKLNDAQRLYQKVLMHDPDNAEALHYYGLVNFQLNNLDIADELMSRSLKVNPSCANTLSDLGMVKVKRGQYQESISLFASALELNSNHIDALNNMAIALKKLNRYEQVLPLYEHLSRLCPQSAHFFCSLADAQYQVNKVAAAVSSYQKAIKLDPDHKHARVGLGEAYEAAGKFRQAKLQYLAVLRRDENSPLALSRLLQLRQGEIDRKWVVKAHELVDARSTESEGRVRLNIALGYHYDRNKAYDSAFHHLTLGCDEQSQKEPYDSQRYTKAIDELIKVLTTEFFQSAASSKNNSERPIFILGMPRSGTTLTEQILSSHSQVAAGGELSKIPQISQYAQELSYKHQPYPHCLTDIERIGLSKLAKTYLDRLEKISATAHRVTDKLPFNFMHLGTIAMLFPNAKIIHCRRHPLDNCLSCYFTSFADQIQFANSQETLGEYYLDYFRLMEHWHKVLPVKIFDLKYEDLINNTENRIRDLLSYCQLDWEDACLSFYETNRGVRTPSRWQVRQPIYSSSMHRWRHYETYLGPLKRKLSPLLEKDGA